ncbi:hypothetical protein [Deinococcus sp. Leaf326]|uniref:hypothetical protein n=1 Tax=Deinococcus sp. Leaf326 TaxID=1736338 RepID=UPI0012E2CE6C|nr:hypothetical protein [Deinococcus sp. Leaf326]
MKNTKFSEALAIVNENRIFFPDEQVISIFKNDRLAEGWSLDNSVDILLSNLLGIGEFKLPRRTWIRFFTPDLYDTRATAVFWYEQTGENIFPFAAEDPNRYYISSNGKVYGDIRDVNILEHYGTFDQDGLYNIIFGKILKTEELSFDDDHYDRYSIQ